MDWSAVEALWEKGFAELAVDPKEHPILLADSPTLRESDREKMAELMFETFNVPAYFVSSQSVLSLFSTGYTSGVVVDSGHGVAHSCAISEGFTFPHTIFRLDCGGGDLTSNLGDLLTERSLLPDDDELLTTCARIKEKYCYVAKDFALESAAIRRDTSTAPRFKLPDGRDVSLETEHIRCTEALFQPALAGCRGHGLADIVWDTMQVCDDDREGGPISTLTQFVFCFGGNSLLPGFDVRLKKEIEMRAGKPRTNMFISALTGQEERLHSAFIGGSILAGLAGFPENNFVSKAEFGEDGAKALHKRCT